MYGPHGYLRCFRGVLGSSDVPEAQVSYIHGEETILLLLTNAGTEPVTVTVDEQYSHDSRSCAVAPGESMEQQWRVRNSSGWYDLAITCADQNYLRRYAGHIETGRPSTSDPAAYSEV